MDKPRLVTDREYGDWAKKKIESLTKQVEELKEVVKKTNFLIREPNTTVNVGALIQENQELKDEIQIITAPQNSTGKVYLDLQARIKEQGNVLQKSAISQAKIQAKLSRVTKVANYPEEPNGANMNKSLVWDYKERLDSIVNMIEGKK